MTHIIRTSFGYDMTINVYAKVLKETAKTMLVQEVGTKVANDNGMGNGSATPDPKELKGNPFRVYKRNYFTGENAYRGKDQTWKDWSGKSNYHNTWD